MHDEESLVNFGIKDSEKDDKIIDIFFNSSIPSLNKDTEEILLRSDIIIFSCGTQFSSLIPTYKTKNFNETIVKSSAKKYLIMNIDYDNDIINYTGNELLNKINEYLTLDDIYIIYSDNNNPNLIPNDIKFNIIKFNYINVPLLVQNNKHNGFIFWNYIFRNYFSDFLNKNYIFDYDYTLYDKDYENIYTNNILLLEKINDKLNNCIVISNNCFSNILHINNVNVYTNMGNILNNDEIINENCVLSQEEIDIFYKIIENLELKQNIILTNRKYITISLKPFTDRQTIINKITEFIDNDKYHIIETGKTTIEFMKKTLSKRCTFESLNLFSCDYTYISDLNDINYTTTDNIKFLNVPNILTTNIFLKTIYNKNKYDFCIIVGGINKRMNIDYPKSLVIIDNEEVLLKIIKNIEHYSNNIYVCCNNYYKNKFEFFQNKNKLNDNIKFLYFNSNDNKQSYPRGNGETIYQLLSNISNLTSKLFVLWGDILFTDNKIIEEMYNYDLEKESDILIPVIKEKDPYAYLILNTDNSVFKMGYKKNKAVDSGYHDQCIFLCNKTSIKENYDNILNYSNTDEINFLDIISYLQNVNYYETKYEIKSFNEKNDLNQLIK